MCTTKLPRRCGNDADYELGMSKLSRLEIRGCGDNVLEDRISSLPDGVLGDILSYLPSKEAVATSVLSRRWRRVYTLVTRLDLDDWPISYCVTRPPMIRSVSNFKMFVDKLVQLCNPDNITSFRLHFGGECDPNLPNRILCNEGCYPVLEPMHLNAWVCFPLNRNLKELDICAHVRNPWKLPLPLFGCQALEVLRFDVNLDIELPSSLHLPNLKECHLRLHVIPDYDFVTRLLSSCPSLQDLALDGKWRLVDSIEISSPSLRRLAITDPSVHLHGLKTKVVFDVPNLEYLVYKGAAAFHYSIGDLNALAEAQVEIAEYYPRATLSFAQSLANVRRLFLMQGCVQALNDSAEKLKLPIFHNLKHLRLASNFYINWNKFLLELLDCAPFLETLAFAEGIPYHTCEMEDDYWEVSTAEIQAWRRTQTIPHCLMSHLKRIIIMRYLLIDWELEVLKYFLRSSLVLEELLVVCHPIAEEAEWKSLDSTLQKLPRASKTCSIEVVIESGNFGSLQWDD